MKSKILAFVAIAAIVTLSFTFVSVKNSTPKQTDNSTGSTNNEPSGGFVSEDKI